MIRLWCFSRIRSFLVFKLTLLLQLKLYLSLSANHFGDCIPIKCGHINISYPFYMSPRQNPYCGYPGFEISCQHDRFPYINISDVRFVVKNVSYEEQTLQVVNSMLLESLDDEKPCSGLLPHLNMTVSNDKFKYIAKHTDDLFLLFDCPQKILQQNSPDWAVCGAVGVYQNESKLRDLTEKCSEVVSVAYDGKRMEDTGNAKEMLKAGFALKWTASNCSACHNSGGECGYDEGINEFSCFCPDRTHARQCPPPKLPLKKSFIYGYVGHFLPVTKSLSTL